MTKPFGPLVAADAILVPEIGPQGPRGPQGPKGAQGDASNYPAVWVRHGPPPEFVEGAKPGDTWIDVDTGDVFEL